jgi:hypothetical protein
MFFALMEVEEKAKTPANLQLFTPVASKIVCAANMHIITGMFTNVETFRA